MTSTSTVPDPNFDLKLPPQARIMGIDVGSHTLGIAFTILGINNVSPFKVIKRTKYRNDLLELQNIIKEWQIKGLVFGLPINMDNSHGPRVQATKTIARNISRDTNLPYCFIDERLSTSAAEDRLIELGVRPSSRKKVIDAHAATIILENYQNFLQYRSQN